MYIRANESGVSPVVAVILMVAVTVLLSVAVGTFVLDLGQSLEDNPRAGVRVDQTIKGNGGDFAAEVQIATMENADYVVLKTNVEPADDEIGMELVHDEGIMYRWRNDTIEWSEFENDGKNKYRLPVPDNSGSVDVSLEFVGDSYEWSGAFVYAKDENGNIITPTDGSGVNIWCDAIQDEGSGVPTDYSNHSSFSCTDKDVESNGNDYYWNSTQSLSSPDGVAIEGIYVATDISNVNEEYWDRAQLHHLSVTSASTGETNVACTECFAQFKSSEGDIDYSNDTKYYASNDAAQVGSTIKVRHLKPETKITIMGVKDGKTTVLETYTVR